VGKGMVVLTGLIGYNQHVTVASKIIVYYAPVIVTLLFAALTSDAVQ
jgi:hypothetical protein